MHSFLAIYREELIYRCKLKVAQRPYRAATEQQLAHGVPMFLEQLTRTLVAEENGQPDESVRISGLAGGDAFALSEIGVAATVHGKELLDLGYSVDQVVHDYGDLCQAITDLAFELDARFTVDEFRTLNRCLDNAIAGSVMEFSFQREERMVLHQHASERRRQGTLAHELRNALETATLAVRALEASNLPIGGSTGAVLKRSLSALGLLIGGALAEVRSETPAQRETFPVASFLMEASAAARLEANLRGCVFKVTKVDPPMAIHGNRALLHGALANLLQNAFKFTLAGTTVTLLARAVGEVVLIDVEDHCGGLPPDGAVRMFTAFGQRENPREGLGLGLTIARQSIEADFGTLTVRDVPGTGCIFTISLPRYSLQ